MTLSAGTRLGSYEVLALLGQGGMGEVEAPWPAITLGGSRQPKSRLP